MKKAVYIFLILFGSLFSIEYVSDIHPNGMPKVIKEYSTSYSKLYLAKEIGYYADGSMKYLKTYYQGELKRWDRWDTDGNKIVQDPNEEAKNGWTQFNKDEVVQDCIDGGAPSREVCECFVDSMVEIFIYSEFQSMQDKSPEDFTDEEQEKADLFLKDTVKCMQP
jgi:hypothetical protein|tara:strand:+ start:1263 stop:1757 length:495 start_codon:yes stop_codon:yes gene_type:complete